MPLGMWTAQERLRFHILGAMAALDAALYVGSALRLRWDEATPPLAVALFLLAGAAYFRRERRRRMAPGLRIRDHALEPRENGLIELLPV